MDRLLVRLERTFLGRLAIPNLTAFIVGGMAIAFVMRSLRPEIVLQLRLVPQLVSEQPWRLVSFLFYPPSSLFWAFFTLYFTWWVGSNLESEWGAFKLNVFYFLGALGTIAAAFITGYSQDNDILNLSLFFAFATLFPDAVVQLFFIIPIRVKWLALFGAGALVLKAIQGGVGVGVAIGIAVGNYLLFFGAHLIALARGRRVLVRQAARRTQQRDVSAEVEDRTCAICGASQAAGADIRVCSCEKCGGPRNLCLEHARDH